MVMLDERTKKLQDVSVVEYKNMMLLVVHCLF